MNDASFLQRLRHRLYRFLESGIEVMARYPYDLTELNWNHDLYTLPDDERRQREEDETNDPPRSPSGRPIKLIPPPASQRYQAEQPSRLPERRSRNKQPV